VSAGQQTPDQDLAEALAAREAELAIARQEAADLAAELAETSRGLIALHAELEQARQDAARLAAIVEWSDDAMFSLSAEGVIRTWNPGAHRLLGFTSAEITGQPVTVLLPAALADVFTALLDHTAAGQHAAGQQSRARRTDGTEIDVTITCSAMRDADGTVTGFSVVLHDITARLAADAELAAARAERDLIAERDRMARDLHDRVIQRIFAAGMSLQTAASVARNPQAAARIEAAIADLDTSIAELRETIFTLRHGPRDQPGLHKAITALASQAGPALGFTPAVSFHGPEDIVPEAVAANLLAVCREALSNIARHAAATAASLTLTAGPDLVLEITDNGRGIGDPIRSSGLRNMRERAELLGGTFGIASQPGAGTRLEWRVPLG
jgi:two-component system sensor histidine kinase DevS